MTSAIAVNENWEKNSREWSEIKQRLAGIGCIPAQLDSLRVRVPLRLWEKGAFFKNPFMMYLSASHCIRAVPLFLWPEYIRSLRGLWGLHPADEELLLRTATEVPGDERHRWSIPIELALRAQLGGENRRVIFTTQEAWVELWEANLWETQIKKLCFQ